MCMYDLLLHTIIFCYLRHPALSDYLAAVIIYFLRYWNMAWAALVLN